MEPNGTFLPSSSSSSSSCTAAARASDTHIEEEAEQSMENAAAQEEVATREPGSIPSSPLPLPFLCAPSSPLPYPAAASSPSPFPSSPLLLPSPPLSPSFSRTLTLGHMLLVGSPQERNQVNSFLQTLARDAKSVVDECNDRGTRRRRKRTSKENCNSSSSKNNNPTATSTQTTSKRQRRRKKAEAEGTLVTSTQIVITPSEEDVSCSLEQQREEGHTTTGGEQNYNNINDVYCREELLFDYEGNGSGVPEEDFWLPENVNSISSYQQLLTILDEMKEHKHNPGHF